MGTLVKEDTKKKKIFSMVIAQTKTKVIRKHYCYFVEESYIKNTITTKLEQLPEYLLLRMKEQVLNYTNFYCKR